MGMGAVGRPAIVEEKKEKKVLPRRRGLTQATVVRRPNSYVTTGSRVTLEATTRRKPPHTTSAAVALMYSRDADSVMRLVTKMAI